MTAKSVSQEQANAERKQAEKAELVEEYRQVGPAAINAALLCCSKAKKEEHKPSYEPREET